MLLDRSGCRLAAGEQEYRVRLPEVTDISGQEGIRLDVELLEEGISEIEVALYPLYIARPEFFPRIEGRVAVAGKGSHRVEIPFGQFAYRQMTGAFLKYLDGISVKVLEGGPLVLGSIAADTMGDFAVEAKRCSKTGEAGEWVAYTLLLSNKSPGKMLVNVRQSLYGKECLPTEYEPYVVLEGNESREYMVKVQVTEDIPPGGLEKSRFLLVPEGRGSQGREVLFQTSKRRPHPYLFLKERDWQRRKAAIASLESLREAFRREYVEAADAWEVPMAYQGEDHVYPAYSQNGLFAAAVAWKVTGEDGYLRKAMEFFQGFLEEERGYLATRRSYFVFVESKKEYARGDFKVCRAQSGGWVQEAEFFIRLAMAYVVWDYLEGQGEHRYDCLYHPVGRFERKEGIAFSRRERFSEDPFGAGQFIQNCYTAQMAGTVCLQFREAQPRVNGNDILDNLPEAALWRIWPRYGEVTIGRYPQRGDTFTEENRKAAARYLEEPLKKTVSFSQKGRSAGFITLLEAGEATGRVRSVSCESFHSILIQEADGKAWRFTVTGMEEAAGRIAVSVEGQ